MVNLNMHMCAIGSTFFTSIFFPNTNWTFGRACLHQQSACILMRSAIGLTSQDVAICALIHLGDIILRIV